MTGVGGSGVALRRATTDDGPVIARLIRESKCAAMPWLSVPHILLEDVRWVAGTLLPEHTVTVAVTSDGIVGVLAVRDGWLEQLYVATESQGRGIGSTLLAHAKEHSPGGLQLWAFQRNTAARRFYEAAGFVAEKSTDGSGNEEREPDVRYRWGGSISPQSSSPPAYPARERAWHASRGRAETPRSAI